MKKQLIAIFTVFALFLSFGSFASADTATDEMKKTIEKGIKSEHKDYKKGSLTLTDVQSFPNEDSELDASEVTVAVANYDTVRDNIFYFDHTEVVYYDADKNELIAEGAVAKANDKIEEYKKKHESDLGTHMDVIVVTALLFVLILVPLFILTVWEKRQYLTTKFKIENNLFNQDSLYR
ncbi:hypothetical protein [Fictibacillus phosphorivorans]|uniref:hypothetical protein n=1 Tax=Fictibacillus phosphorivorans TaxID=1221500 RepID=UPI00203ED10F|nr:hypothetical protein [Fictibacillus phosphorivorans]MCM3717987.1 hypothetical protein [Fictibacillus phosphorivorans]MCM3775436.1 hypothetical protein [Fictibacillus phosphorivorans]